MWPGLTDRLRSFAVGASCWSSTVRCGTALCRWRVGDVALTQIGRSAPPHEQLVRAVAAMCPHAFPAHGGLPLGL